MEAVELNDSELEVASDRTLSALQMCFGTPKVYREMPEIAWRSHFAYFIFFSLHKDFPLVQPFHLSLMSIC